MPYGPIFLTLCCCQWMLIFQHPLPTFHCLATRNVLHISYTALWQYTPTGIFKRYWSLTNAFISYLGLSVAVISSSVFSDYTESRVYATRVIRSTCYFCLITPSLPRDITQFWFCSFSWRLVKYCKIITVVFTCEYWESIYEKEGGVGESIFRGKALRFLMFSIGAFLAYHLRIAN